MIKSTSEFIGKKSLKTDISKTMVSFTQFQSGSFLIESTFEMIMIKKSLKMDIDHKFTFEIITKKLIDTLQKPWFTSMQFNWDLQYHSGSK